MLVPNLLLVDVLGKAHEIAEQYKVYCLDPQQPKKRVQDLLRICTEYLNKKVELYRIKPEVPRSAIEGYFLLVEDRYLVFLLDGMNECWDRFVLTKELFHAIIDDEKFRTIDVVGLVEEAVVAFPTADYKAGHAVLSEKLAEIAAMEFLFPYADRLNELSTAPSPDYSGIAHKYKIPQYYVELYLSQSYMKNLKIFVTPKPT